MIKNSRGFFIQIAKSFIVLVFAYCLYIYPAIITFRVATSQEFIQPEANDHFLRWFNNVSKRFEKWSTTYLKEQHALSVSQTDVAATEWPMFGSVFYLLTAEEIKNQISQRDDVLARETMQRSLDGSEKAIKVIVDPSTANWVKNRWGKDYLNKENIFYRMLLIMGLSSYEAITDKRTYHDMLAQQTNSLADELLVAPNHLLDDYPGECWPTDVLWAVAAIRKSDKLIGTDHSLLAEELVSILDTRALTEYGLPAFKIDSRTMRFIELPRGCGNSGILIFAPELDIAISQKWYNNYEKYFWQENALIAGFREFPFNSSCSFGDVDSGPVIGGYGSVATFFGIGASRRMGRFDQAIPMTKELIAISWPTPFGYLIPSLASWLGTRSWVLGETAMLFSMTRTNLNRTIIPDSGKTPGIIWIAFIFYSAFGIYHIVRQFFIWKRFLKNETLFNKNIKREI